MSRFGGPSGFETGPSRAFLSTTKVCARPNVRHPEERASARVSKDAHAFVRALSAALALVTAVPAHAAYYGHPADARIRVLPYDPSAVVRLDAYFGYQLMVQFALDERVQNVAIGDGSTWQVTPNKEASLLFVKPVEHATRTNMTVVTDRRSYLFELDAHPASAAAQIGMTYVVRFLYPPPPAIATVAPAPPPAQPERRNTFYTYTGSRDLLPSVVFDDGRFTYFRWPDAATTPAVFSVEPDGQESLVNYTWRDGYEVVEQIAPRFTLRDGKTVTNLYNDGFRAPLRGAEAPRPHDAKTAKEAAKQGARP